MEKDLKAPFPYFGGKRRVAPEIWKRFGNVSNYCEPFAGSLAVLLCRPSAPQIETVNDIDCHISNFWRALKHDPKGVAKHADWPVFETDLHARHLWLVNRTEFRKRMKIDPDYYDVKVAGWWVWGACAWIAGGWCSLPENKESVVSKVAHSHTTITKTAQSKPSVGSNRGILRQENQMPQSKPGVSRGSETGVRRFHNQNLESYFNKLAERLRNVRVLCGSWDRMITSSVTTHHGVTGVLLDPPYADNEGVYAESNSVSADVFKWAKENGDNPLLRIALCGYAGEHSLPGWTVLRWKATGGFSNANRDRDNKNAEKETIWFSPHTRKSSLI